MIVGINVEVFILLSLHACINLHVKFFKVMGEPKECLLGCICWDL